LTTGILETEIIYKLSGKAGKAILRQPLTTISSISGACPMKAHQICENFNPVADVDTLTSLRLLGINGETLDIIRDELSVHLWIHDEEHKIVYGNNGFTKNFGTFLQQTCHQCMMKEKNICSCCLSKRSMDNEKPEWCRFCKRRNSGYDINIIHTPITNKNGRKFILHSSLHIKNLNILTEAPNSPKQKGDEEKKFLIMHAACKKAWNKNNNETIIDNLISSMT
jgi:hypothetical protein